MKKQWPVTVTLKDGKFFIESVREEYAALIQQGDEIIKINRHNVSDIYSNPDLLMKTFSQRKRMLLELQSQQQHTKQVEILKVGK